MIVTNLFSAWNAFEIQRCCNYDNDVTVKSTTDGRTDAWFIALSVRFSAADRISRSGKGAIHCTIHPSPPPPLPFVDPHDLREITAFLRRLGNRSLAQLTNRIRALSASSFCVTMQAAPVGCFRSLLHEASSVSEILDENVACCSYDMDITFNSQSKLHSMFVPRGELPNAAPLKYTTWVIFYISHLV